MMEEVTSEANPVATAPRTGRVWCIENNDVLKIILQATLNPVRGREGYAALCYMILQVTMNAVPSTSRICWIIWYWSLQVTIKQGFVLLSYFDKLQCV